MNRCECGAMLRPMWVAQLSLRPFIASRCLQQGDLPSIEATQCARSCSARTSGFGRSRVMATSTHDKDAYFMPVPPRDCQEGARP